MIRMKMMYLSATLFGAALVLSGCGGNDSKALSIAEQLVKSSMKSPASFSAVSTKIVFNGVNKDGAPAYIVRVDYDAENSFGAMLRGCNLAAFYLLPDDKFGYKQNGLDDCMGSPGSEDEAFGIEIDRKFNEFTESKEAPAKTAEAEQPPAANAPEPKPEPAAVPAVPNTTPANSQAPIGQIWESNTGRSGTVNVRYDQKTAQGYLYVNDILVPKDLPAVAPSIVQKWDLGDHEVYLLSDSTGGAGCPATYFFLNVQNGSASTSENFGNCSDLPKTAVKQGEIIITFGKFGTAPENTIRFTDGKVFSSEDSRAETPVTMTQVKI